MKSVPATKLRIIDANINRTGEGLRVLEEFARLSLNEIGLTERLKNMRHRLVHLDAELQSKLIGARDAAGDVGAGIKAAGEEKQRDAAAIVIANARRVEESLRVLEELAKEPGLPLKSTDYEKSRFELYTIEKELLSKLLRQDRTKRIKGLYVIIDIEFLKGRSPLDAARAAIKGGATIIQLRDKKDSRRRFYEIAVTLQNLCKQSHVLFIVNDSLEVALAANADALNVGQQDLPVVEARRLLPIDKLLGASASTLEEARTAQADGADYLGVGAIYATATKKDIEVVGLGKIKQIKKSVNLPIVAIGGINRDNIADVMKAGADAVAVISAVLGAADMEKATRQLVAIIEGEKRG
jgi:thiamine-phosphate pyrophosphorylase